MTQIDGGNVLTMYFKSSFARAAMTAGRGSTNPKREDGFFFFFFFSIIFFAKAKEPQNSKANTNVIQKKEKTEHKNRDNYYLNLINSDLKEEKDKEEVISEGSTSSLSFSSFKSLLIKLR